MKFLQIFAITASILLLACFAVFGITLGVYTLLHNVLGVDEFFSGLASAITAGCLLCSN